MQIDPMNSVNIVAAPTPAANLDPVQSRQLVTAVRALNQSEFSGEDRQLQFVRDPGTRLPVIKIVQPSTGEVIDQIPPEVVLRAFESLQSMGKKESGQ